MTAYSPAIRRLYKSKPKPKPKRVIDLSSKEARQFFLSHDAYSSIDLPKYFRFTPLLKGIDSLISNIALTEKDIKKFKGCSDVNYSIYVPKGDKYSWRKLQLISPILYIKLIQHITEPKNWKIIQDRFVEFESNKSIRCMSLPVKRTRIQKLVAAQIESWVENVERESVRLSIKFEYLYKTDIANCYSSIYTHSVAWAIHTKPVAKTKRKTFDNIGNIIDNLLQAMSHGQTNGIPEGSSVMDFVAEIVLGYADIELTRNLDGRGISRDRYQVIRYRDDYRIFVDNERTGEEILQALATVLMDLGLRLNASKTSKASNVVLGAIKSAKLDSYSRVDPKINNSYMLRNELLYILDKSLQFSDSGFCKSRLSGLIEHVDWTKIKGNEKEIVAIAMNIANEKPDSFTLIATIISKFYFATQAERTEIFQDLQRKVKLLPNSGLQEIWLQRISAPQRVSLNFSENLCKVASGSLNIDIFPEYWKPNSSFQNLTFNYDFIDLGLFRRLSRKVAQREVLIFYKYH